MLSSSATAARIKHSGDAEEDAYAENANHLDDTVFGDCQIQCGATSVDIPVSPGRSISFGIGNGSRITYQPKTSECLSHCQVVDYTVSMTSCGKLYRNSIKVSKASFSNESASTKKNKDQYKLCCVPKPCNYMPEDDSWSPHMTGQVPYYLPLQSLEKKKSLNRRACTCCDKPATDVPSGRQMVEHCKLAYDTGTFANMGKALLKVVTLFISDWASRRGCESYCGNYQTYAFGKYTWEWTSLAAFQVQGGLDLGPLPTNTGGNAKDDSAEDDSAEDN